MMGLRIPKLMLLTIVAVGLIFLESSLLQAQHKILFLRLHMQNDSISLVRSSIRSGVLKNMKSSAKASGIEYQCRSSAGQLVLDGVIDDPSFRRYEFDEPLQPGKLKVKQVKLKDVLFTLRIPLKEGMHHLEFFRVSLPGVSPRLQKAERMSLGTVVINPE
jgi:hypothetical protein